MTGEAIANMKSPLIFASAQTPDQTTGHEAARLTCDFLGKRSIDVEIAWDIGVGLVPHGSSHECPLHASWSAS